MLISLNHHLYAPECLTWPISDEFNSDSSAPTPPDDDDHPPYSHSESHNASEANPFLIAGEDASDDLRPPRRRHYPYKFPYFLFPKKIPYALASHRPDTDWVVTRQDHHPEDDGPPYQPYNYYSYYNFTYLFPHSVVGTDLEHENRFDTQSSSAAGSNQRHRNPTPNAHQKHNYHNNSSSSHLGTTNTMHHHHNRLKQQHHQDQMNHQHHHVHHQNRQQHSNAENDISPWNAGSSVQERHGHDSLNRRTQGRPGGDLDLTSVAGGGGGGHVVATGRKPPVTIMDSNRTHYVEHIKTIGERTMQQQQQWIKWSHKLFVANVDLLLLFPFPFLQRGMAWIVLMTALSGCEFIIKVRGDQRETLGILGISNGSIRFCFFRTHGDWLMSHSLLESLY